MSHGEWWRRPFDTTIYFELYEAQDTELAQTQVFSARYPLDLTSPARILDVGCGYGRHSVELARRGFEVTGVDITEVQLTRARERAEAAEATVDFRRLDARALEFEAEFDAAINMFLSFGFFETDEKHLAVLAGINRALRPGGRFLMDFWNRDVRSSDSIAGRSTRPATSSNWRSGTLTISRGGSTGRTTPSSPTAATSRGVTPSVRIRCWR